MEDLFKKFINAGVGFVSLTTDRVQSTIDALVKESKLSEQEGAKIMDELRKNGETKRKELEKQFQGLTSRLMKTVGVAPNAEVEELKRTVKGSGAKAASGSGSKGGSSASKSGAGSAASATSKAAGTAKKAATGAASAAGTAQKSAAGKAGAEAKNNGGSKSGAKKPATAASTEGAGDNENSAS
jgi:polyhydroxyalkanoate synthesis regulator phasin